MTIHSSSPPRSRYAAKLHEYPDVAFPDAAAFAHRGRWADFFRDRIGPAFDGHVVFEVGCFDAAYLARIAGKFPTTGFVGLDWKCKAVYDGAKRVTDGGLRNVALLRGRAQDVGRIFAAGEVDEMWVFHPDPCDRPAELPNRLFAPPFLAAGHDVLRNADSTIVLKTDHPGYYHWALALLGLPEPPWFAAARAGATAGHPRVRAKDLVAPETLPSADGPTIDRFRVTARSADFWGDAAVQSHVVGRRFAGEATLFEQRFVSKRLPIYYLELGRRAAGGT